MYSGMAPRSSSRPAASYRAWPTSPSPNAFSNLLPLSARVRLQEGHCQTPLGWMRRETTMTSPARNFETVLTLSDDACDDDRRRALLNALCPCIRPSPASSTSPEEMRGGVR